VLVLMDEPAFPGCLLSCRPIGVIEGEQVEKKQKIRNDRIVAIEQSAHSWRGLKISAIWASISCENWKIFLSITTSFPTSSIACST